MAKADMLKPTDDEVMLFREGMIPIEEFTEI